MRIYTPGFKPVYVDEPAPAEDRAPPKAPPLPSIQAAMAAADARQAMQKPIANPGVEIIPPVRPKMIQSPT